ncbi:hypothetical protein C8R47DRAFT_1063006 [Mycena vitilis]|nr:hypothetical protein C8R47DRAFT_1063006 [Mycena vitilis]
MYTQDYHRIQCATGYLPTAFHISSVTYTRKLGEQRASRRRSLKDQRNKRRQSFAFIHHKFSITHTTQITPPTNLPHLSLPTGTARMDPQRRGKVASSNVPAPRSSTLPEDLERLINEVVLKDSRDMCATMSLVASRFYFWTKPFQIHTVVIHQRDDWIQRVSDYFLPNASAIRTLVLNLPYKHIYTREIPANELSLLRGLLEASGGVRHLAVTWNIWAELSTQSGALHVESLYLIWDGEFDADFPSLDHLQHPTALKDLTVYGPPSDREHVRFQIDVECFLPSTMGCDNLAYITYVAHRVPPIGLRYPEGKSAMLVRLHRTELSGSDRGQIRRIEERGHQHFSTVCVFDDSQVLIEWVTKVEGRQSVLNHLPHAE